MTVKDQIPSFPELVAVSTIRDLVAHGSDDYSVIASKYHSNSEREHADELALNRIIELLTLLWHFRLGDICKEPVTVRTLSGWRSCEEVEDRLPDGRHAWLWWRS